MKLFPASYHHFLFCFQEVNINMFSLWVLILKDLPAGINVKRVLNHNEIETISINSAHENISCSV